MIFLLFPAMTVHTVIFIWATFAVVIYIWSGSPIVALVLWVIIKLRFSSKILPIMWKYALVSKMVSFIIRAPHSFEMEHVEIWILHKFINKLNRYFWLRVCKRAILSILTLPSCIYIRWAKFSLVFIRMIKFLNSIMWFLTCFPVLTFLALENLLTYLRLIRT